MSIDLYDLSDEELEIQFRAAKEYLASTDQVIEEPDHSQLAGSEEQSTVEDDQLVEQESEQNDSSTDTDNNENVEQGSQDEQPQQAVTQQSAPVQQKIKVKANGAEYEFTEQEMRERFPSVFAQAMNYTQKTQAIKPWRKTIDALEQAKLSHDDINLYIAARSGDKGALNELIKTVGVDALDLGSEEDKYVPKDYGRSDAQLNIQEIVSKIGNDPEYAITQNVLGKQWDEASWKMVNDHPNIIEELHIDIKNGVYQKVQPMADKMKLYDQAIGRPTASDIDYYVAAGRMFHTEQAQLQQQQYAMQAQRQQAETAQQEQQRIQQVKTQQASRQQAVSAAAKRKTAAPTVAKSTSTSSQVFDDSDEAFEEWYARLNNR